MHPGGSFSASLMELGLLVSGSIFETPKIPAAGLGLEAISSCLTGAPVSQAVGKFGRQGVLGVSCFCGV